MSGFPGFSILIVCIRYSPLSILYIFIACCLFPVAYCLFPIPYSLFPIPYSLLSHFIAALLMPVMMYFCRKRNSSTMGIMAITAPAMISL